MARGVLITVTIDFPEVEDTSPAALRDEVVQSVTSYLLNREIPHRIAETRTLPYQIGGTFEWKDAVRS